MPRLCLRGSAGSIIVVLILTFGWSSVCGMEQHELIVDADWPEKILSETLASYGDGEDEVFALRGVRTFIERAMDDSPYRACQITDPLMRSNVGCQLFGVIKQRLINDSPDFGSTMSFKQPLDASGTLPVLLLPLSPGNTTVDGRIVAIEKPTYYWYLRLVYNLYHHAYFTYGEGLKEGRMAAGWGQEREYMNLQDDDDERFLCTPMAASIVRADRMVIIIRGTISGVEWTYDFDYKFAPLDSTRPYFGEHRVHSGFFRMFIALVGEITEEVARVRPQVITVTGHSLGGAVSTLLALHLHKTFRVHAEAVLFAAPITGDENFIRDLSSCVESRHILYVGRGWDAAEGRRRYTCGDALVQFGCSALLGCPNLGTGTRADEYKVCLIPALRVVTMFSTGHEPQPSNNQRVPVRSRLGVNQYAMYPHLVPFTPYDLPNTHSWLQANSLVSLRVSSFMANHICSYMCLLASHVGDAEDRCYFEYDEGSVPLENRCTMPFIAV